MYSPLLQTHYEILGLKQNCSSKQIRDAFVSISKKVNTFSVEMLKMVLIFIITLILTNV
jgi:hypothetical protein